MITIFHTQSFANRIEAQICLENNLEFQEILVKPQVMSRMYQGKKSMGLLIELPNGEVLENYFDLCKWIEKEGLRQI